MRQERRGGAHTPIIVIGNATTAMSCIRLVAKAGYSVFGACRPLSWPTKTRHFRSCPRIRGLEWRGELDERGENYLRQLPFDQCILLPAADDAAIWVAELPAELRARILVSSPSPKTIRQLQDKEKFADLMTRLNVSAPVSFAIRTKEDFDIAFGENIPALFLKPIDSQAFVSRYNKKAIWVDNEDEARSRWHTLSADGFDVIAQEYVPGGPGNHYFIDGFRARDGAVSAITARRRVRIYPRDFGNSSYCESICFSAVSPAWDALKKVLDYVNYRGIFSAEFKKDANSDEYKILEINTRPWVYIEFAERCGLNFCEMYIKDALGQDIKASTHYDVGRGCVSLYDDLIAIIEMPREERPRLLATLWKWSRSFKLLFSIRDPWPAAVFIGRTLRRKVWKLVSK